VQGVSCLNVGVEHVSCVCVCACVHASESCRDMGGCTWLANGGIGHTQPSKRDPASVRGRWTGLRHSGMNQCAQTGLGASAFLLPCNGNHGPQRVEAPRRIDASLTPHEADTARHTTLK
jgi:hypothetical protein